MEYKEVDGDLIKLTREGEFDVIAHGCNCFCRQKRGLAPQMAAAFKTDLFLMEHVSTTGDINKLGQIDYEACEVETATDVYQVWVVNCYTQYQWSTETKPFDYEAFTLCMRKIAHKFKGMHVGLPALGAGLAGGDFLRIKDIIQKELVLFCDVTVVIYKP